MWHYVKCCTTTLWLLHNWIFLESVYSRWPYKILGSPCSFNLILIYECLFIITRVVLIFSTTWHWSLLVSAVSSDSAPAKWSTSESISGYYYTVMIQKLLFTIKLLSLVSFCYACKLRKSDWCMIRAFWVCIYYCTVIHVIEPFMHGLEQRPWH